MLQLGAVLVDLDKSLAVGQKLIQTLIGKAILEKSYSGHQAGRELGLELVVYLTQNHNFARKDSTAFVAAMLNSPSPSKRWQ